MMQEHLGVILDYSHSDKAARINSADDESYSATYNDVLVLTNEVDESTYHSGLGKLTDVGNHFFLLSHTVLTNLSRLQ